MALIRYEKELKEELIRYEHEIVCSSCGAKFSYLHVAPWVQVEISPPFPFNKCTVCGEDIKQTDVVGLYEVVRVMPSLYRDDAIERSEPIQQ